MGSLDAWLVDGASLYWATCLGHSPGTDQTCLCTLVTTAVEIFGSQQIGVLAACLLAIPAVNVTLYTTASLGGYGEALVLGNLILLLALRIAKLLKQQGQVSGFDNTGWSKKCWIDLVAA
jgi:hypothetical protein